MTKSIRDYINLIENATSSANKQLVEDSSAASFAGLKDWQEWNVKIRNNFYTGKYATDSIRLYSVVANSPEEARQLVLDNAEYVLSDLLSKRLHSGKRLLPPNSARPLDEKNVLDKAVPGSLTTVGFKKMLTPNGPMMLKFSNGKIVDSQESDVTETAESSYHRRVTKGIREAAVNKKFTVSMDVGPHQSIELTVSAKDEKDAERKAVALANKKNYRSPMVNWTKAAD